MAKQNPRNLFLCNTPLNYTPSSPYSINLNLTLSSLVANAPLSFGFNSTAFGINTDQVVYGLLQCRGDISPQQCQICGAASSAAILKSCLYKREAVAFYDNCWLRYADYHFFDIANTTNSDPIGCLANEHDIIAPTDISVTLFAFMNNLSASAASNSLKFSTGVTHFTGYYSDDKGNYTNNATDIYGLVQCTRDLSKSSCLSCLRGMINYIPYCDKEGSNRVLSKSCMIRYEKHSFFNSSTPTMDAPPPFPPTIAALPPRKEWIEKKEIQLGQLHGISSINLNGNSEETSRVKGHDLPSIHLDAIQAATSNFSNANKLGQGGFGPVYKGMLHGKEIAVKRLSERSGQGSREFKNEVILISKLQHRNLVRLLGYCMEGCEKLLIYEYMPNTSLDVFIFDPARLPQLDWKTRYSIITGVARGLLYLHEDSRLKIIHRDLKASNILLDNEMTPKISDFGLAKIFRHTQSEAISKRIVGTYGYIAPEYARDGQFSVKSDVFSFGVLLLEIISGKKNNAFQLSEQTQSLPTYAWRLWSEGKGLELMDPLLKGSCVASEAMKCLHVSLLCVQEDPVDRPTMSTVVVMLVSDSINLAQPRNPASSERVVVSTNQSSNNEVTISSLSPR
ncbi:hypothetical protein AQUCO_01200200v1 [Aquilegia coerulea]|uniref:non-specific serine/threonine protein kinase n=1 Tax=Aquilegia coerulea TaxID=218851 RepID=A0A2G5E5G1_AQUCA|nr:hypothetical protein AQUCO_01200200v1 [Aquilegia coerulea]